MPQTARNSNICQAVASFFKRGTVDHSVPLKLRLEQN